MHTNATTEHAALYARRGVLVQRLDDGDRRIEDARHRGAATDQWETFWLQLLDEYVAVSELLANFQEDRQDIAA